MAQHAGFDGLFLLNINSHRLGAQRADSAVSGMGKADVNVRCALRRLYPGGSALFIKDLVSLVIPLKRMLLKRILLKRILR